MQHIKRAEQKDEIIHSSQAARKIWCYLLQGQCLLTHGTQRSNIHTEQQGRRRTRSCSSSSNLSGKNNYPCSPARSLEWRDFQWSYVSIYILLHIVLHPAVQTADGKENMATQSATAASRTGECRNVRSCRPIVLEWRSERYTSFRGRKVFVKAAIACNWVRCMRCMAGRRLGVAALA